MRILLVVHGFPPAAMGGTEIYTHDLARALLQRSGDEVFVFAREADTNRPEYSVRVEQQGGLQITFVNNTFRACRSVEESYRNPSIRDVGVALVDEIRPDVVHIQHLTCLSTDLVIEFARRRIPTVFTLNDYWLICHRGQLLDLDYQRCEGPYPHGCPRCIGTPRASSERESENRLRHMRTISGAVTHFLAPSNTLRERFLTFGLEPHRITYREQGIDQSGFRGIERAPSHQLRIGFMGSLLVSKAPHLLFEAFAGLPSGAASLHVFGSYAAYHGDDGYRQTLAATPRLKGVHLHGAVPHDQIPSALGSIDVLVVPSVWIENAPFVIREAFVAGIPVIASNLGGMAEMVIDGRNGLLFEVGNAADLGRCLRRLIDEPTLLERLRSGISRMKTIQEDAAWTRELYVSYLGNVPHVPSTNAREGGGGTSWPQGK
jgi:glycosyltransferase involved in cell wall biosynthesis